MSRLQGKVAIVFGAGSVAPGSGNGKTTAVLFARNGAHVVCVDVNGEAAEETFGIIQGEGNAVSAFACNVTDSVAVRNLWNSRRATWPHRCPACVSLPVHGGLTCRAA